MDMRAILETYRWHRALGQSVRQLECARIVLDPDHPNVWDTNHADSISAASRLQIDEVLEALDSHLAHSDWRVVHTDPETPEAFLARLALEGFAEQAPVVQMALDGHVRATPATHLRLVESEEDWAALADLVAQDHREGLRTGQASHSDALTKGIIAGYRARSPDCQFFLSVIDGKPVAYGSLAAGPTGAGIIEDLFTLPDARGQGLASGMIAAFADRLRGQGCGTVFLGALMGQRARLLYSKIGFVPVLLTRTWVRRAH